MGAGQLGELARIAAVVDVIDAMGRARPDRAEQTISSVYRQLIGREGQLDKHWCQYYARHFGLVPIGSLVRFSAGGLGWVERLDRKGAILQVRLTDQPSLRGATSARRFRGRTGRPRPHRGHRPAGGERLRSPGAAPGRTALRLVPAAEPRAAVRGFRRSAALPRWESAGSARRSRGRRSR
ncbi:hypothetical protein ACFSHR_02075 [Azotobacter chroococcum]